MRYAAAGMVLSRIARATFEIRRRPRRAIVGALVGCGLIVAATPADDAQEKPHGGTAHALDLPSGYAWRAVTPVGDVTLDGIPDAAFVGSRGNRTALLVVKGPVQRGSERWMLEWTHHAAREDALCGTPRDVTVATEEPVLPLDELGCPPEVHDSGCDRLRQYERRLSRAARNGSKGLVVRSGDCDAVHVYFDGTKLRTWRR